MGLWPETSTFTTGYDKKSGASSSWYNHETTVDGRPYTSAESVRAGNPNAPANVPVSKKLRNVLELETVEDQCLTEATRAASRAPSRPGRRGSPMSRSGRSRPATSSVSGLTGSLGSIGDGDSLGGSTLYTTRSAKRNMKGSSSAGSVFTSPMGRGASRSGRGGSTVRSGAISVAEYGQEKAKLTTGGSEMKYSGPQMLLVNTATPTFFGNEGNQAHRFELRLAELLRLRKLILFDSASHGIMRMCYQLAHAFRERNEAKLEKGARFDPAYVNRDQWMEVLVEDIKDCTFGHGSRLFTLFDHHSHGRIEYAIALGYLLLLSEEHAKPGQTHSADTPLQKLAALWDL